LADEKGEKWMIQSLQIQNLQLKLKAGQIQHRQTLVLGPLLLGKIQDVRSKGCLYIDTKTFVKVTKMSNDKFEEVQFNSDS
jgi:hypothetical protein